MSIKIIKNEEIVENVQRTDLRAEKKYLTHFLTDWLTTWKQSTEDWHGQSGVKFAYMEKLMVSPVTILFFTMLVDEEFDKSEHIWYCEGLFGNSAYLDQISKCVSKKHKYISKYFVCVSDIRLQDLPKMARYIFWPLSVADFTFIIYILKSEF